MTSISDLSDEELLGLKVLPSKSVNRPIKRPDISSLSDEELLGLEVLPTPDNRTLLEKGADFGRELGGTAEVFGNIGSQMAATPIAGLAGAVETGINGPEAGEQRINQIMQAGTLQPKTPQGQSQLQSLGETVKPVGDFIQEKRDKLGGLAEHGVDAINKSTSFKVSPEVKAGIATSASMGPDVLLEVLGFKGTKSILKRGRDVSPRRLGKEKLKSAPSIEQLKESSELVYDSLDQSGIKIRPDTFLDLREELNEIARKSGFNEFSADQNKNTGSVLRNLNSQFSKLEAGEDITVSELNQLRVSMANAQANAPVGSGDARIISKILDKFDDALDNPDILNKIGPDGRAIDPGYNISEAYSSARELWRRAKGSETIQEIFNNASLESKRGLEISKIQNKLKQILTNPKKRRFFSKDEQKAMMRVVRGDKHINMYKWLADHFDPSTQGMGTTMITSSVGFAATGGNPVGLAILPTVGIISRELFERMTKGKAIMADAVIRAGRDGDKIIKAYYRNTPKSKRKSEELSQLLARDNMVMPSDPAFKGVPLIDDALELAKDQTKALAAAAGTGAGINIDLGDN